VQFIDVGDLGRFCIRCLEERTTGVFNAVHAPGTVTMGKLLETSQEVTGGKPEITWIPAAFLRGRPEFDAIPIWSPPSGDTAADHLTRNDRAVRAGLETTPLETTVGRLLAWHAGRPPEEREKLKAGLTPDAERALLAAWRAQVDGG
jgi:nucleoside-diphosphate-sugar epimerase